VADFAVSTAYKAIDKTTRVLKHIARSGKAAASGMAGRFKQMSASAVRSFKVAQTKITAVLSKLSRKTEIFGKGFKKAFTAGVAIAGIASFTLAAQSAISTGLEFEQTIVNAAAKFPGAIRPGTKEFQALEAAARDVGATTEFTASEAASGLNFLAMAGMNAEQSIAALPKVVDLATASQTDLATATDIATDTLGAMGLATSDAAQLSKNLARVNDVMAKTVTTSNTDMIRLFETIKEGGPVAISAGSSLEQFAAMAGVLANSGIKSGQAGTTLKNVFLRLAAATPEAAKQLKRMGVQTKDSSGNLRDVVDILGDLDSATKKLGTAEKAAVLNEIFGKIPIAGVNILLDAGADKLRAYQKQLEGAAGASKQMADVMRGTTLGSFKTMKSAAEGLGLTIFKQLQPSINSIIKGLTSVIRVINKFLEANPWVIKTLVAFAKIAAPVLAVASAIAIVHGAILALNIAMIAFNVIMAANPVILVVLAITAAIAAIIVFRKQIIAIGAAIVGLLIAPIILFMKLLSKIPGLGALGRAADSITGAIKGAISEGFGGDVKVEGGTGAGIVAPQAAMTKKISETTNETQNKLVIEDRTGRARMTEDGAPGVIQMTPRTAGMDEGFVMP